MRKSERDKGINSNAKEHRFIGNAMVAAIALSISIPLASANETEQKTLETEKQVSMNEPEVGPKLNDDLTRDSKGGDNVLSGGGQYSMGESGIKTKPHVNENLKSEASSPRTRIISSYITDTPQNIESWEGLAVYSSSNEKIGKVEDVIVDRESSEVTHIVIDYSGIFSGSSIVPLSATTRRPNEAGVSVDIENFQGNDNSEPKLNTMQSTCTTIVGAEVRDANGQEIGEIKRLVIAPNSLRVYAVIEEFEDGVGIENKTTEVAIPLSALENGSGEEEYVVDFGIQELKNTQPKDIRLIDDWSTADEVGYIIFTDSENYAMAN